jgi:hypothetical protein
MNQFATLHFKTKTGFIRDVIVTSQQMAEVGLKMGWISPDTKYAKKLASTWESKNRRTFIKTSSKDSNQKKIKLKFSAARWVDLGVANGWIRMGMNKKAGFWSGVGETLGAGWNAAKGVGNAAIGAGNAAIGAGKAIGNAVMGAGQFAYNGVGQLVDAGGNAIKAKANQAGQVIDATGKVIGALANQGAQYVGGLANEAKAGFANTQQGGARAGTINPMTGLAEAASPVTQPVANAMVAGYDGASNMAGKGYNAVKGAVGKVSDAATMAAQVAQMSPAQLQAMQKFLASMPVQ